MSQVTKNISKTKEMDEVFCHSCGNTIKSEAVICVHCGVETANSKSNKMANQRPSQMVEPKDKTTAVLLAVFLGFWTWIYTYKIDAWKFWLNLALSVITFGFWGVVAWIWAVIDSAVRDDSFYKNFPNSR